MIIIETKNYEFTGDKLKESQYISEISKKFDIAKVSVVRFLKTGRNLGWCKYITCWEKSKEVKDKVLELYKENRNQSIKDIAKQLGIKAWDVSNATKQLIKDNEIIARR